MEQMGHAKYNENNIYFSHDLFKFLTLKQTNHEISIIDFSSTCEITWIKKYILLKRLNNKNHTKMGVNSGVSEGLADPAPLVAPVEIRHAT